MTSMHKNIISLDKVENFTIDVNEQTVEIFMEEFVKNAFIQKNLKFKSSYKIFYSYMYQTQEYQISYYECTNKNQYIELECFEVESNETQLIVCKDFFVLFCEQQLYYYQKLTGAFDMDEIKNYVHKRLNIDNFSLKIINSKPFEKSIELKFLKKVSYKYSIALALYCVLLLGSISYVFQMNLIQNSTSHVQLVQYENMYEQLKKRLSFDGKVFDYYNKLNKEITLYGLLLLSFEFQSKKIKIVLSFSNKKDLYRFLNTQGFKFQNSSFNFQASGEQYVLHTEIQVV